METFKAKPSLSAAKQLATVAAGKASRVRTARSQQSSGPHAHSDLLDLLDRNGMALETEVLAACWVGKTGMRQGLISDIGRSTSKVKAGGCIWTHGTISGREQGSLKTCGNSPALHVQVVAAALLGGTLWWKRLRQSRV